MVDNGVPTLSQVRHWSTEHLDAAASQWTEAGSAWQSAFDALYAVVQNPGGTVWDGSAAEAALVRAQVDRARVYEVADAIHGAAAIARSGSVEIAAAKQRVLAIVSAAQASGLVVNEDLSVTDASFTQRSRIGELQKTAAALHDSVTSLARIDSNVASKLSVAQRELEEFRFEPLPASRDCCGDTIRAICLLLTFRCVGNDGMVIDDLG